jgi:succinate dehydrogenase/fumarate reductase iron-sulfur protein
MAMSVPMVSITVFRFDPDAEPDPRHETYRVPCAEGAMVLDALEYIRERIDPTLRFRHSCHMGKCGTCAVTVNGVPKLACWEPLREGLTIDPLAHLPLVADLVVDRAVLDRQFEGLAFEPAAACPAGELAAVERASWTSLAHNCLQCFSCLSVCPYQPLERRTFVGPKYMVDAARVSSDPRARHDAVWRAALGMGVWDCVTCEACTSVCPASVDPMRQAIEVRRGLVEAGGADLVPAEIGAMNDGLMKHGSPWGTPRARRGTWSRGIHVERPATGGPAARLFLAGCYAGGDAEGVSAARAAAELLRLAGRDVEIPVQADTCCGDPARSTGEQGLFDEIRSRNTAAIRAAGASTVVTACPHALDAFTRDYDLGGVAVRHYTQVLAEAAREGRLSFRERPAERVTYHDPCYLGRFNGIYDEPRELLRAVPGLELVEMAECRERGLCCGGGGGAVFSDPDAVPRVPERRVAQAVETGATTLAVACQYCFTMLSDAAKTLKAPLAVRHVADIVRDAVETPR